MNLQTADHLVQSFIFEVTGAEKKGLMELGMQTIELVNWGVEICFVWLDKAAPEYQEWQGRPADRDNGTLLCFSRIYTFQKPPETALLEELRKSLRTVKTGGGELEYIEALGGLYLTRAYKQSPGINQLKQQLVDLVTSSLEWLDVLEECIERVRRDRS